MSIKRETIKDILGSKKFNRKVNVKGWVRTKRGNNTVAFVALNDCSVIHHIQIVIEVKKFDEKLLKSITTGSCINVTGKLVQSLGKGQSMEIQAEHIELYGSADPDIYPLQKKGHTLEYLREIAHLRPRTNTFGAVLRIRHALSFAIHKYFNDHGFYYLHTPIITGSDAEGAGEMFRVTNFDAKNPPLNADGSINFGEDFFGRQ